MLDGFMKAICQMGIFMICAQAILHFRPNGSYEKYMKMLVSVMILVQLFLPIIRVLSFGGQGEVQSQMEQFQLQIQASMDEARKTSLISDDILSKMTLEEVKLRINEQQENKENQLAGEQPVQQGEQLQDENNQQAEKSQEAGSQEVDWNRVEESVRNSRKANGGETGEEDKITDDTKSGASGEAIEPVEKIEIKIGK